MPVYMDIKASLVGRKIVDTTTLTDKELKEHGWDSSPLCLVLDDGTILVPSRNMYGTHEGCLFLYDRSGPTEIILSWAR